MFIEHHQHFTAVYWFGQLAGICLVGSLAERQQAPTSTWHSVSTWAASAA